MVLDTSQLTRHVGRWVLLILAVAGGWLLISSAVHPMMAAAPYAKTLSALIGYGLVVSLVCLMRWSPLQPLLAPLFDEVQRLAAVAVGKEEEADPLVRAAAAIACGVYGGITFGAVVIAGAMLAGVAH